MLGHACNTDSAVESRNWLIGLSGMETNATDFCDDNDGMSDADGCHQHP